MNKLEKIFFSKEFELLHEKDDMENSKRLKIKNEPKT